MELGPEDVSLLERCPHFRGCCVQASMELRPEDVSLLERCPHFRGCPLHHSRTVYSSASACTWLLAKKTALLMERVEDPAQ